MTTLPWLSRLSTAWRSVEDADGVEGDVDHAPAGGLGQVLQKLGVVGPEDVVSPQPLGPLQALVVEVDADDRHGAGQPCELDDVRAYPAQAPYGHGVAGVDLAGAHDGAEGSGHGVGEDGGFLEVHLVRYPGHAHGVGDGVLRPAAVVGEGHELEVEAGGEVSAATHAAGQARAPGRGDDAVADLPAGHAGAEGVDGAGCLVTLGHHRQQVREVAVDEGQVGVADAAVGHLDAYLAWAGLRNRNLLNRHASALGVETLGEHHVGHVITSLESVTEPARCRIPTMSS